MSYTDKAVLPIGERITYERGDGAVVDLKITQPVKLTSSQQTATSTTCPIPNGKQQSLRVSKSVVIPAGVPIVINPNARVNMRGNETPKQQPGGKQQFNDDRVIDHPSVGGKYTAFILFYGDYHDLHRKCLMSFLSTVKGTRVDLRVGSNAVCQATLEMIEQSVAQGFITKHYYHPENAFKYPVMREMFYDESHPITTKWILWFDDDSLCDVEPNWMNILSTHIAQHHKDKSGHMVGAKYHWGSNRKQREVLASRPWYRGRQWRGHNEQPSPNGTRIYFVTGGFWALTTEAMRAADIPDLGTGLTHNGGDWQIGEQLYQAGYGLLQFNGKKQFVRTSSVDRRGVTMPLIDQTQAQQQPQQPARHPITPPRFTPVTQSPATPKLRRIVEL